MTGVISLVLLLFGVNAANTQPRWFINHNGAAQSPPSVEDDETHLEYLCDPGGGGVANPEGDLLMLVSYAAEFEGPLAVVNGEPMAIMPMEVASYGTLYFVGGDAIRQAIHGTQLRVAVQERILGMTTTMTYHFPLDGSADAIRQIGRGCGR